MNEGGRGGCLVLSTAASNTFTASPKTFNFSLLTHTHTHSQRNQNNSISFTTAPLRNLHLLSLAAMLSAAFFPAVIRYQPSEPSSSSHGLPAKSIGKKYAPVQRALSTRLKTHNDV